MDKSASQSRLSHTQLPPQEAGSSGLLSLDQVTDLDQAITLSRQGTNTSDSSNTSHSIAPTPAARPTPVAPIPTPTPKAAPIVIPAPEPLVSPAAVTTPIAASSAAPVAETPPAPTPVRSAKDAINAMYAAESPARLSDYLGASAKEIINASARPATDSKSASSLHHASNQRRLETARPSASALFRAAKSETTVVRTSLSLEPQSPRSPKLSKSAKPNTTPKAAPIVISSRARSDSSHAATRTPKATPPRPKKGQIKITTPSPTAVAASAITEAAHAATAKSAAAKSATIKPTAQKLPAAPRALANLPNRPHSGGLVQDIARRPARSASNPAPSPTQPQKPAKPEIKLSLRNSKASKALYQGLPADSVKRRFRLAPKGFAAQKPEQARPAQRKFISFSNPDYTVAVPKPTPAIEIYGLTQPAPDPAAVRKDGLGVVEDYRPTDPANPAKNSPASNRAAEKASELPRESADDASPVQKPASKSAPDNNRYALGGRSPFFLESVNVEKRPLSNAPTRRADTISPLYTDPGDEVPRKNVYDGKSPAKNSPASKSKKTSPRDLPQRPTVIIPSSRRSHTPLFLLLILTVLLGAAVGAAAYFFFFQ